MADKTHDSAPRKLQFASFDEMLADAERVARLPHEAPAGSTGQNFMHLARVIDASIDGFPSRPAWPIRLLGRFWKRRILAGRMPAHFSWATVAGDLAPPATSTSVEAGLKGLREAVARLGGTAQRAPHPALGPVSREEWDRLHLRHAEIQLGSLVPQGGPGSKSS